MHRDMLLRLVDAFRTRVPRAEATISNWICGQARLFARLRAKRPVTDASYERAFQWFSDHWPEGLEWPADIPRPTPNPDREKAA